MTNYIFRASIGVAIALLVSVGDALSQENTLEPLDAITLERIPERIRKADNSVFEKANNLLARVESELGAGRISAPTAQGLRVALSKIAPPIGTDLASILRPSLVPVDNDKISSAFQELQNAWDICKREREELAKQGVTEAGRRASEVVRTAKSAADVSPSILILERFYEAAAKRPWFSAVKLDTASFWNSEELLLTLQRSFEPRPLENLESVNKIAGTLYRDGKEDASARVAEVLRPYTSAEESTRSALDAALIARRPSSEIYAEIDAYVHADGQLSQVRAFLKSGDFNYQPYHKLADVAWCMETRRWSLARKRVSEAEPWMNFKDSRKERFSGLLKQWDAEITKGIEDDRLLHQNQLRTKFRNVKTVDALEGLALELKEENQYPEQETQRYYPVQFPDQLTSLAAEWRALYPASYTPQRAEDLGTAAEGYAKELVALQGRVQRDVWSHFLKAPELKVAPLMEEPLSRAIDIFCKNLGSGGNWPRLFEIQKARSLVEPVPEKGPLSKASMRSIHAFLAGQNFELAEECAEAAAAYKAALQAKQDDAPAKEAAERLNALQKEHPEALPSASNQTPSPRSRP